jgi:beta-glucanase (GH16 family)
MYNLHGCSNFNCRKINYDYEVELAGSFHTYGVNWQKKYIEFYIDNQLFKRVDYIPSIADSNLFTSIDYIDIPLQVVLYGYNATSDPLKMVGTSGLDYTIDYFRYYKLKPYVSFVSSSLTSNIIKVTTTSDVENDTYSFSFIPNCLFSTANMNSFSKVTFPLDVTNRTINLNSSQNIHQRHTTTINDVSVFTLSGSTNFENISSNNSYIINKNISDISLNNPVSKTIYVAPNINCPQNGGTALLSNNGEYILNAINNVTLNPGFELSLGATLYIETINP